MSKGELTRNTILRAAYELTYQNGFQATSIDEILKMTHVTKGSFFHHFKNKDEMGLAMIREILYPGMFQSMINPLLNCNNHIDEIYNMMKGLLFNEEIFDVKYGCPAVNLIEEMAPINPSFQQALSKLTDNWDKAIQQSIRKAKKNKQVGPKTSPKQVAVFIISGYGGIRNLGKLQGKSCYTLFLKELKSYLDNL